MNAEQDLVHEIRTKQIALYRHVQRMADDRLPEKVRDRVDPGRRQGGRPAKSWIGGIQDEITRCNLPDDLRVDQQEWQLGVAEHLGAL